MSQSASLIDLDALDPGLAWKISRLIDEHRRKSDEIEEVSRLLENRSDEEIIKYATSKFNEVCVTQAKTYGNKGISSEQELTPPELRFHPRRPVLMRSSKSVWFLRSDRRNKHPKRVFRRYFKFRKVPFLDLKGYQDFLNEYFSMLKGKNRYPLCDLSYQKMILEYIPDYGGLHPVFIEGEFNLVGIEQLDALKKFNSLISKAERLEMKADKILNGDIHAN